ncbi:MAG: GNAT family N-acetyltransferase [Vicinamibacteria bacterium]|nr:GNAT family N-acetyltransferase [Vicinamibacteria bacterium]
MGGTLRTRPLSAVSTSRLRALLDEEARHWLATLRWDYSEVGAAVLSGLQRGSVFGRAMDDGGDALAYGYSIADGSRVVIGGLFTTARLRGQGLEEILLDGLVEDARRDPEAMRVEAQTLFCTGEAADARLVRAGFVSRPRHYVVRDLDAPLAVAPDARMRTVRRDDLPAVAELIWRSHEGSLDARLNSTYATAASTRGFVDTIVLRNGCGRFDPDASRVAETGSGRIAGVLLASRLSNENGHVCQVSVAPDAQGHGLGRAMLLWSMDTFRKAGLSQASLSVTVGNERARELYARLGFVPRRAFAAHAWARPPQRIEAGE